MGQGITSPAHLGRDRSTVDWNRDHPPALSVASGVQIELEMLDAAGGQLGPSSTLADFHVLDPNRTMPIHGPIYVEGAKPGDVLQVDLLEIEIGSFGWTGQRPGQGVLPPEMFPEEWVQIWTIDGDRAAFRPGISIPLEPFPGMIGVALADEGGHSSDPPRRVGGNMDTKQLVAGSTLYLPIEVEGALFGIGDGHAAQGDGEVCGSAIEVPMDVSVRLTVRRDFSIDAPQFEVRTPLERPSAAAAGYYVTTGVDPDLYAASREAVHSMVRHLAERHGLDPQDAYGLCSVAADLKISEIVDWPNLMVSLFLPLDIFSPPGS